MSWKRFRIFFINIWFSYTIFSVFVRLGFDECILFLFIYRKCSDKLARKFYWLNTLDNNINIIFTTNFFE